ncbi:hypothetical protein DSL64_22800 [Dyadobacter luteus]|jgi:transmembrane sensor|uniref:FecR family protein n=1 Tax=Dyadobacter luteus TaxID=2259619 RepID=A0A3D8Y8N7_9BACT|nr:FecR family protein [Dyadobacter luteus]REA57766.1 hypothetical protein DSL64_22800 [Dyadobacter luteus]
MQYKHYKAEDFAADESFIAYYLNRDAEAVRFWQEWINDNPDRKPETDAAIQLLNLVSVKLPESEFSVERKRMQTYIGQGSKAKTIPIYGYRKYWVAAASLLLTIGVAAAYLLTNKRVNQNVLTTSNWVEQVSPNGKKTRVRLADGTLIILNGGSVLHYPHSFAKDKREIRLTGEAFFSVAHDTLRPFTVHTGNLQTRVLGTEFNVSAYVPDELVTVALTKGKVRVSNGTSNATLAPGQKAIYKTKTDGIETVNFNPATETGWKDGKLVFENASFSTIASAIEHAYGYQIVDKTTREKWNYTGTFTQEDVLTVVENICFSKHLNYTVDGQTITITSQNEK